MPTLAELADHRARALDNWSGRDRRPPRPGRAHPALHTEFRPRRTVRQGRGQRCSRCRGASSHQSWGRRSCRARPQVDGSWGTMGGLARTGRFRSLLPVTSLRFRHWVTRSGTASPLEARSIDQGAMACGRQFRGRTSAGRGSQWLGRGRSGRRPPREALTERKRPGHGNGGPRAPFGSSPPPSIKQAGLARSLSEGIETLARKALGAQ